MTVGTDVKRTILWIVTKIMTPKAFSEGGCRLLADGDVNDSSGGREGSGSIGKRLKKGPIEGKNLFVDSSIFGLRFHSSGGGSARGRRGRGESRQKDGWGGDDLRWGGGGGNRNRQWGYGCREFSLFQIEVTFFHSH